jgi:hypothetical protein
MRCLSLWDLVVRLWLDCMHNVDELDRILMSGKDSPRVVKKPVSAEEPTYLDKEHRDVVADCL